METRELNESTSEPIEQIVSGLRNGLMMVDTHGQVVWMDAATRRNVNGGLHDLRLPLERSERGYVDCFVSTVDVVIKGQSVKLCVLQEAPRADDSSYELVAAVEAVMSDSSWFTRTMVEKFKAWRQTKQPSARSSDLELLTTREREILALICEGLSDYEMSKKLNLSQNTVRNHVASLYRKIGVNRRSAAIIWARERALTSHEFMAAKGRGGADRARHG